MNRRRFIQSLAAVFTLPANPLLSLPHATAAIPTAAVPTQARFWAIYMSALHGECTPKTLQNLLHIPEADAKRHVSQLIADGVIKPNPLLQKSVSNALNSKNESLSNTVKEPVNKAPKAEMTEKTPETTSDATEYSDTEEELTEENSQLEADEGTQDEIMEEEQASVETVQLDEWKPE